MSDEFDIFSRAAANFERSQIASAARKELESLLRDGTIPTPPGTTVEAILEMSSPPWHTACINPFVEGWAVSSPESPSRSDPGPYLDDVQGSKGTLQYKAHAYPTKVPPEIIVRLMLHYTEPGDVVLDAFAGSGMTGVAAQMCATPDPSIALELKKQGVKPRWGARRAVLSDLAPGATFLASGVTLPVDPDAFDTASSALLSRLDSEIGWMHRTTTPDGVDAIIDYTVWSEVFTCPHCAGAIVFYDAAFEAATGTVANAFPCPNCSLQVGKTGSNALLKRTESVRLTTGETIERRELRPVVIHYRYRNGNRWGTGKKRLDESDFETLRRVSTFASSGVPNYSFPYRHMTHERTTLQKQGFRSVAHLYSDRALVALGLLWTWAGETEDLELRRALKFWVEQAIWGMSWMNRYKANDHSQVNRNQSGVYYVSSLISECSPRYNLEGSDPKRGKRTGLVKLWRTIPSNDLVRMSTGTAAKLPLMDESVDYIFVDPPFGENIYYADLAQMVEAWHGVLTDVQHEAIVDKNKQASKDVDKYGKLMASCFREFARVLKPGRWMTVEFSNSSNEVWGVLQQALAEAGFVVADTRVLDKMQSSYRQATAMNAVKQDLMISCYKPDDAIASAVIGERGAVASVWAFVGEHLKHLAIVEGRDDSLRPVRERYPDRIYDRVVAYFVSAGLSVPMTASEFYRGLEAHFNERDGMYFRPDQAEAYERKKVTFKALDNAALFVTDEKSAVQWLRQRLKRKAQTMAEVQPAFLQELAAGSERPDQLPDLRQLLEQNFIQDSNGAWSVPDPRRVDDLEQLRQRELLRIFDGYARDSGPLGRFRGEAVAAGFKKAWTDQDYITIVNVGTRLPQAYLVELPAVLAYVRNARARLDR